MVASALARGAGASIGRSCTSWTSGTSGTFITDVSCVSSRPGSGCSSGSSVADSAGSMNSPDGAIGMPREVRRGSLRSGATGGIALTSVCSLATSTSGIVVGSTGDDTRGGPTNTGAATGGPGRGDAGAAAPRIGAVVRACSAAIAAAARAAPAAAAAATAARVLIGGATPTIVVGRFSSSSSWGAATGWLLFLNVAATGRLGAATIGATIGATTGARGAATMGPLGGVGAGGVGAGGVGAGGVGTGGGGTLAGRLRSVPAGPSTAWSARGGVLGSIGAIGPVGVLGRMPPSVGGVVPDRGRVGTAGITYRALPGLGGTLVGMPSPARSPASPIATHSASALVASIRPAGAGGVGRGAAGTVAGRGRTVVAPGRRDRRAFSSSPRSTLLGSSGASNRRVIPTRPWSTEGVFEALTTSASPSSITPPSDRVTANRARAPAARGSAIGTNTTPLRST